MPFKMSYSALALITLLVAAAPASAQTYGTWQDPDAEAENDNSRLQDLVSRLRAIVDQAEKDRAADPLLLQDLRALADNYDRAASDVVLSDDFSDGDFTANPAWRVIEGRYWVEKDWGLRNALEAQRTSSTGSGEDLAAQIFGQVLTQALGGGSSSSGPASMQPTVIVTDALITNAFSARIAVTSWVDDGRLIMGPWQSEQTRAGYRLVYNVGGSIDLVAVSGNGARIISSASGPYRLEDKAVHEIVWDRDRDGAMRVTLDGVTIIETSDRGFRDDFSMWGFASRDGDFIVKSVTVASTP